MAQHFSISPTEVLKNYWGYTSFRPMQEEVIQSIIQGCDTLALMPTGGGKSLCYQVPAIMTNGLCLVISPLIALMKDQVEHLRRKSITAFAIYSGMSRKEVINTLQIASESNCKFLYVSPERLETSLFHEYLPGLNISLIAVDEAHCISQWGYDFRPPYLRIAALRKELPHAPILALTASATPDVQKDICEQLEFKNAKIFRQSFERANLSYSVFKVDSKINKILEILKKVAGTSIVYCRSRKRTKEISELLSLQNISSDYYHAGLTHEERDRKQDDWIKNKTRVIVCTNAFGMGIDKPDVRTVIHADVPESLEYYYQEAGRAGRDGKTAYAALLYDQNNLTELEELLELRFPSLDEIKNVYQAVANYLQIPSGVGQGQYYSFDIVDFIKKFKLTGSTALYSLKALEQDGWLSFNEQVFLSSTVVFTTDKDYLYEFEKRNTSVEPLIKILLRSYDGIFNHTSSISEKMIAGLLKTEEQKVIQQLTQLHTAGIIDYQPRIDSPQIYFLRPRIRIEELKIDMRQYQKRKEVYQKRIKQMQAYILEDINCRSQFIGAYFGDGALKNCGICDNCLKQKNIPLTKEEFEALHHRIINIVKYEPISAKELVQKLGNVKKEKAWKIIDLLQAEHKIEIDKMGKVRLK